MTKTNVYVFFTYVPMGSLTIVTNEDPHPDPPSPSKNKRSNTKRFNKPKKKVLVHKENMKIYNKNEHYCPLIN